MFFFRYNYVQHYDFFKALTLHREKIGLHYFVCKTARWAGESRELSDGCHEEFPPGRLASFSRRHEAGAG